MCNLALHLSVTEYFPIVNYLSWPQVFPLLTSAPAYRYYREWQDYPGMKEKHSTETLCQEGFLEWVCEPGIQPIIVILSFPLPQVLKKLKTGLKWWSKQATALFSCPQIEGFWFTVLEDVTQTFFGSKSSTGNFPSITIPTPCNPDTRIYLEKNKQGRANFAPVTMKEEPPKAVTLDMISPIRWVILPSCLLEMETGNR